jgi:hypothetical protein
MSNTETKTLKPRKISGNARLILGLLSLVSLFGMVFLAKTVWFVTHARVVTGVVVKIDCYKPAKARAVCQLHFKFTDETGNAYTLLSIVSVDEGSFREGEEVKVLYDASNPGDARIDTFETIWLRPIRNLILTSLLCGFAWLIVYSRIHYSEDGHRSKDAND